MKSALGSGAGRGAAPDAAVVSGGVLFSAFNQSAHRASPRAIGGGRAFADEIDVEAVVVGQVNVSEQMPGAVAGLQRVKFEGDDPGTIEVIAEVGSSGGFDAEQDDVNWSVVRCEYQGAVIVDVVEGGFAAVEARPVIATGAEPVLSCQGGVTSVTPHQPRRSEFRF